jgi:hypothetical protein
MYLVSDCTIADRQHPAHRPRSRICHFGQAIWSVNHLASVGSLPNKTISTNCKPSGGTFCSVPQVCIISLLRHIRWLLCYLRLIYPRAVGKQFPGYGHAASRPDRLPPSLVLGWRDYAAARLRKGLRSSRVRFCLGSYGCSTFDAVLSLLTIRSTRRNSLRQYIPPL